MRIAVTGSRGFLGSALASFLAQQHHEVVRVVRSGAAAGDIVWDPAAGRVPSGAFDGVDGVVHLAGESLAGRWTPAKKAAIHDSRLRGTRALSDALAGAPRRPRVLVCASAVGYYGNRGGEILTEHSMPGTGFLADVCQAWEAAADPARQAGIRVVSLRIGVVLSPKGGALAKLLTPFQLGLGGVVGDGRQYWSWIALDDVIGAMDRALMHQALAGPVNVVAPSPATNREFTATLGRVLGRPTMVPLPAFAARLMLGEFADEALLASARVQPSVLVGSGYRFRYPDLESALRHVLSRG